MSTDSFEAETLRSTCSLTDVILSGKDIELLLLKKEVEEKLNALNSLELGSLPNAVNKAVEFVAGSVDVGHIRDHDHPSPPHPPSNRRNRRTNAPDTISDVTDDRLRNDEIIRGTEKDPKTTKPEMTSAKSKDDASSSSSSDSESDSDDGEKNSKDESKTEVKEMSVQTEKPDDSSSDSDGDDETEMKEHGTMTDSVETEDRGVNTTTTTTMTMTV